MMKTYIMSRKMNLPDALIAKLWSENDFSKAWFATEYLKMTNPELLEQAKKGLAKLDPEIDKDGNGIPDVDEKKQATKRFSEIHNEADSTFVLFMENSGLSKVLTHVGLGEGFRPGGIPVGSAILKPTTMGGLSWFNNYKDGKDFTWDTTKQIVKAALLVAPYDDWGASQAKTFQGAVRWGVAINMGVDFAMGAAEATNIFGLGKYFPTMKDNGFTSSWSKQSTKDWFEGGWRNMLENGGSSLFSGKNAARSGFVQGTKNDFLANKRLSSRPEGDSTPMNYQADYKQQAIMQINVDEIRGLIASPNIRRLLNDIVECTPKVKTPEALIEALEKSKVSKYTTIEELIEAGIL